MQRLQACCNKIPSPQDAATRFECEFRSILDVLQREPIALIPNHQAQPLSCLTLCRVRYVDRAEPRIVSVLSSFYNSHLHRDTCLHNAGFRDIFYDVKARENQHALAHLPAILEELDGQSDAASR